MTANTLLEERIWSVQNFWSRLVTLVTVPRQLFGHVLVMFGHEFVGYGDFGHAFKFLVTLAGYMNRVTKTLLWSRLVTPTLYLDRVTKVFGHDL